MPASAPPSHIPSHGVRPACGGIEFQQRHGRIHVGRDRGASDRGSPRRDHRRHGGNHIVAVSPTGKIPAAHQTQRISGIGAGSAEGAPVGNRRRPAEVTGAVRRPALRGRRMRRVPRQILDVERDIGLLTHKAS
jgi:hypothetical protein